MPARGGYTVQPVPAPASIIDDAKSSKKEGGRSQKLILWSDEMIKTCAEKNVNLL